MREPRHVDDVVDASDVCVSIGSAFNLDWYAILLVVPDNHRAELIHKKRDFVGMKSFPVELPE